MTDCDAEFPCLDDPDNPCFCRIPTFVPKVKIRYSARFVEQVRELGTDKRWPLRKVDPQ